MTAGYLLTLSVLPTGVPAQVQAQAGTGAKAAVQSADSVTEVYRATLLTLRDTIAHLNARLSHLRRQLSNAGSVTLLRWTGETNLACRRTLESLETSEPTFRRAGPDRVSIAARSFAGVIVQTRSALRKHCAVGISPEGPGEWADSLRAWVPYHVGMVERQLATYHQGAARFARAAGIKLEPRIRS